MSASGEKVDTNLYSRQIGTFGMETMGKLIKMKILIVGLRGLGVETAKNIILAGPHEVQLYDPEKVKINDLGGNFYLKLEDVNKTRRDEASITQLSELNPYVHVSIMKGELIKNITNFNVVVITEMRPKEELIEIDEICRKNKIAFIYSAILGLSGFIFDDFGPEHTILDDNGEDCKTYIVKLISNDGCVTIDDSLGGGKFAPGDGDYVKFREVGGMTQLNDGKPREIKVISQSSFKVVNEDFSKYPEFTDGGIVEQVKVPKKKSYKSLKERFETLFDEKPIDPLDFSKFGRNELLFITFLALHEYYSKNKSLPELNNKSQVDEIVKRTKELYDQNSKLAKDGKLNWFSGVQDWDEKIPAQVAAWSRAEISPVCAFLGGVLAQEIVKYTGKYTPINQWLLFDFFETVANLGDKVDRTLKNSRYDDQIAIYGNEIQKKIEESNIFMIGAGALGCEFLKNFALMGMSTAKGKNLIVTDNDNIETSNLNRQFLFRKTDIGHSKSKCACEAVKKMNPAFNSKDLQSLVAPVNERIFNEKFWNDQTYIINAVDNIQARKYIDNQCTTYGKCLIDSGTLGTKAHVQMVVPHVTSCYNDSQDPPEEGVPLCTMHNFPAMIEHCIEWGRDHFNEYFTDVINDAKKLLENKEKFYSDLKKEGNTTLQLTKLKFIKQHVVLAAEKNIDKVIEFAVMQYTENFQYRIQQLLFNFPEDYMNKDGTKFWAGSKRVPHPIPYSVENPLALMFVKNYATILARALSIKGDLSDNHIKEVSSKVKIPPFVAKTVKIKVKDDEPDEPKAPANEQEIEEAELSHLMKELSIYDKEKANPDNLHPEDFEKDDDSNGHIDFIHACSNLRAQNYKIKECDRQKTKMIAGKIIPAIATTTAAITGIVSLQLYTLYQTNKIDFLRDCYLNLAINSIFMSEPKPAIKMKDKDNDPILLGPVKAIPPNWTVWDKIIIEKSMTCKELIDYIMEKYKVEVSIITAGSVTIIQTFMPSSKKRLPQKIEDIYNENAKDNAKLGENDKYLNLEISGDIGDATAVMPMFKYIFKN